MFFARIFPLSVLRDKIKKLKSSLLKKQYQSWYKMMISHDELTKFLLNLYTLLKERPRECKLVLELDKLWRIYSNDKTIFFQTLAKYEILNDLNI